MLLLLLLLYYLPLPFAGFGSIIRLSCIFVPALSPINTIIVSVCDVGRRPYSRACGCSVTSTKHTHTFFSEVESSVPNIILFYGICRVYIFMLLFLLLLLFRGVHLDFTVICLHLTSKMVDDVFIFERPNLPSTAFPVMAEIRRRGKLCDVTLKVRYSRGNTSGSYLWPCT